MKKKKLHLNKSSLILIVSILIVAGLQYALFSKAKYVNKKKDNVPYEAYAFYFQSDLLSKNNIQTYTLGKGQDTINFTLCNNEDELRYAEVNIQYEVTVTDLAGNSVKDKDGEDVQTITGTITGNAINSNNIEISNLGTGTYLVQAKAVSPYEETIQGVFNLTEGNYNIQYSVNDSANSPVMYLTVKTTDESGNIKITYPNGIIVNNIDNNFSQITNNYVVMNFNVNSEYSIQFFKENPSNVYTNSNFTAEKI